MRPLLVLTSTNPSLRFCGRSSSQTGWFRQRARSQTEANSEIKITLLRVLCFISLQCTSTWGSSIPTYLSMYCILYVVAIPYVGIVDPHVFINALCTLFCCNTQVRGDRRSPRIYQCILYIVSLKYTSAWGSSIPTYSLMYFILYFIVVDE